MTNIASVEDLKKMRRELIESLYYTDDDDEERIKFLVKDNTTSYRK